MKQKPVYKMPPLSEFDGKSSSPNTDDAQTKPTPEMEFDIFLAKNALKNF